MELAVAATSVSSSSSLLPILFDPRYSSFSPNSLGFRCFNSNSFPAQLQYLRFKTRGRKSLHAYVSQSKNPKSPELSARWLMVPVGDGDSTHIGFKVEMPDAFEIVSNEVIVGRLPDKADVVIPVATVSGLHARIQKQEERLLITDLGSTNGTFINDKRLSPGVVAAVSSGNCITFGDTHLAMYQVSRLKTVGAEIKVQESEDKADSTDDPTTNQE